MGLGLRETLQFAMKVEGAPELKQALAALSPPKPDAGNQGMLSKLFNKASDTLSFLNDITTGVSDQFITKLDNLVFNGGDTANPEVVKLIKTLGDNPQLRNAFGNDGNDASAPLGAQIEKTIDFINQNGGIALVSEVNKLIDAAGPEALNFVARIGNNPQAMEALKQLASGVEAQAGQTSLVDQIRQAREMLPADPQECREFISNLEQVIFTPGGQLNTEVLTLARNVQNHPEMMQTLGSLAGIAAPDAAAASMADRLALIKDAGPELAGKINNLLFNPDGSVNQDTAKLLTTLEANPELAETIKGLSGGQAAGGDSPVQKIEAVVNFIEENGGTALIKDVNEFMLNDDGGISQERMALVQAIQANPALRDAFTQGENAGGNLGAALDKLDAYLDQNPEILEQVTALISDPAHGVENARRLVAGIQADAELTSRYQREDGSNAYTELKATLTDNPQLVTQLGELMEGVGGDAGLFGSGEGGNPLLDKADMAQHLLEIDSSTEGAGIVGMVSDIVHAKGFSDCVQAARNNKDLFDMFKGSIGGAAGGSGFELVDSLHSHLERDPEFFSKTSTMIEQSSGIFSLVKGVLDLIAEFSPGLAKMLGGLVKPLVASFMGVASPGAADAPAQERTARQPEANQPDTDAAEAAAREQEALTEASANGDVERVSSDPENGPLAQVTGQTPSQTGSAQPAPEEERQPGTPAVNSSAGGGISPG